MNNQGQAVLSEYVMIFFVVIAALVAMTTYVQRGFEARIHDARNLAMNAVVSSGACDANCLQATGGNLFYEYEPYYAVSGANVQQDGTDTTGATKGNPQALGAIYTKSTNESTGTVGVSCQLPPECAGASVPLNAECTCPSG
jgi:hypothetical protein